ncbi:MAG: hypothetical protein IT384_14815 [Deltaproteobacteria bacterium]|nr:hypothetical protein [Deltaproteobacteria bacterium]
MRLSAFQAFTLLAATTAELLLPGCATPGSSVPTEPPTGDAYSTMSQPADVTRVGWRAHLTPEQERAYEYLPFTLGAGMKGVDSTYFLLKAAEAIGR